jgi:hypothetical protein
MLLRGNYVTVDTTGAPKAAMSVTTLEQVAVPLLGRTAGDQRPAEDPRR